MLVRPALREYRTWTLDSRQWNDYQPRPDDIIVATYPKSGTTWMQRIVNLLIFQNDEARPIDVMSPWIDRRFGKPIAEVWPIVNAQTHRRAFKTHLPLDGVPLYDGVKYIHVARDGRDAAMSFHNHGTGLNQSYYEQADAIGLADESIARPYPRTPAEPAEYFHQWLRVGAIEGQDSGYNSVSYFEFEQSYWSERHRKNLFLVNYTDMKADLAAEMRRVAEFLNIEVSDELWPIFVKAAGFEAMKKQGGEIMPNVGKLFTDGTDRFFNKGVNGRWQGVFVDEDLALYDEKLKKTLPPECIRWLHFGKEGAATLAN
jgi:aryl sulfotransferase